MTTLFKQGLTQRLLTTSLMSLDPFGILTDNMNKNQLPITTKPCLIQIHHVRLINKNLLSIKGVVVRILIFMLFLSLLPMSMHLEARNRHRKSYQILPEISTRWLDEKDTTVYSLKSIFLEEQPLFSTFDREHIFSHLLPSGPIAYRNNKHQSVDSKILSKQIEEAVELIKKSIRKPPALEKKFTILKQRNFDWQTHAGLLIMKFKKYPFVVKLFMETPKSFVKPFTKDLQQACFFVMGSGINRYLLGFTRIKNLEAIRARLNASPYWSSRIDTPRKWFWISPKTPWFELRGKNIGSRKEQKIELPSYYALIADAIEADTTFRILNSEDRKLALELSHFLGLRMDPHIDNFLHERGTGKIVLVDTEHFPTLAGIREPIKFNSYYDYFKQLTQKFCYDCLFRSKKHRQMAQRGEALMILEV